MKPAIEHRDYFKEKFAALGSDAAFFTFENILFASRDYRLVEKDGELFPLYDAGKEEILLATQRNPDTALQFLRERGLRSVLVTDEFAENYAAAGMHLCELPHLHNYIYATDDLAQMSGGAYESQRRQINSFTKSFNFEIEDITPGNIDSLYSILNKWERDYQLKHPGASTDYYYQFPAIYHFFELGLDGIIVTIDGAAAAFACSFDINAETFCGYTLKTDRFFKGMYEFLIRQMNMRHISKQRFNYCEDSGVEGLAEAKMRLKPSGILKIYAAQI